MELSYGATGPFSEKTKASDQVFLVPRGNQYISEFLTAKKDSVRYVNDHKSLEGLISDVKKSKFGTKANAGLKVLSYLFDEVKFKAGDKAEIVIAQNANRQSYKGFSEEDIFYIKEDSIEDTQFARFLEPFLGVATKKQPLIMIEAESEMSALRARLEKCPEEIVFREYGAVSELSRFQASGAVNNSSEFVRLYSDNCFSSIARIEDEDWQSNFLTGDNITDYVKELLFIRAKLLSTERHHVTSRVKALLASLDSMEAELCRAKDYDDFLLVRAFIKLNLLYCTEDPQGTFDHAMAVSAALENDLLKAYTLRYANFIQGNGFLKTHLLEKAEAIFTAAHIHDHAMYCRNNRLATEFRMEANLGDEFDYLVEDVDAIYPHLHRKEDMIYNSALCNLLQGKYEVAFDRFASADECGGRTLISATSKFGMALARHLDGQEIKLDEILEIHEYLSVNVDPSNKYHTTNLKLNMLTMAKALKHDTQSLEERFGHLHLGRDYDVKDSRRNNDYMASKLGRHNGFLPPQTGIMGRFVKEHGFALPYFYIWS